MKRNIGLWGRWGRRGRKDTCDVEIHGGYIDYPLPLSICPFSTSALQPAGACSYSLFTSASGGECRKPYMCSRNPPPSNRFQPSKPPLFKPIIYTSLIYLLTNNFNDIIAHWFSCKHEYYSLLKESKFAEPLLTRISDKRNLWSFLIFSQICVTSQIAWGNSAPVPLKFVFSLFLYFWQIFQINFLQNNEYLFISCNFHWFLRKIWKTPA